MSAHVRPPLLTLAPSGRSSITALMATIRLDRRHNRDTARLAVSALCKPTQNGRRWIYRNRFKNSRRPTTAGTESRPIRRLPFSRLSRGSAYLPLCREVLHILLGLRRPKPTPKEATSSFSFYLQGRDQRGHHDGCLLSANTKFVNPVFAQLEP
jgi:hypothetical protein